MTKKRIIVSVSILIAVVIMTGLAIFFYQQQRLQRRQKAIQTFGIHETDDISISDYDKYGLWGDQSLSISTQKDFDRFVNENIMASVTITDETDPPQKADPEVLYREISFKYRNGNQEIYGKFFISNNGGINKVLLLIYG